MFKATRELIKARQIHTKCRMKVVSVKQIGGGESNDCFSNACNYKEKNKRNHVVSGWLVNKYEPRSNATGIKQHFWNINEYGVFEDTSTNVPSECEYVIDMDILAYGQLNYKKINSFICSSLLLEDGKFETVDLIYGRLFINSINKLNTKNLFDAVRIDEKLDNEFMQFSKRALEMRMA